MDRRIVLTIAVGKVLTILQELEPDHVGTGFKVKVIPAKGFIPKLDLN